jgi:hypothetical protein
MDLGICKYWYMYRGFSLQVYRVISHSLCPGLEPWTTTTVAPIHQALKTGALAHSAILTPHIFSITNRQRVCDTLQ